MSGSCLIAALPLRLRADTETIERELSVQLEHHNTHGGVDYLSANGTVAP